MNNTSQNTQTSERSLRDTDMASEEQRFSVSVILGQLVLIWRGKINLCKKKSIYFKNESE